MKKHFGFTLIELLVIISIIGILSGLLLPVLSKSKNKVKKLGCTNNIRQLLIASINYSADDSNGNLSAKVHTLDQNLNFLFNYTENKRIFSCPSTRNFLTDKVSSHWITNERGFTDLFKRASSNGVVKGSSYLGAGFTGVNVDVNQYVEINSRSVKINGIRKNTNNINWYTHYHNSFGLKGVIPGPSRLWLLVDNTLNGVQFYPDDRLDNHLNEGVNVGFCDGHVEWVKQDKYVYSYELSQDENRTTIKHILAP